MELVLSVLEQTASGKDPLADRIVCNGFLVLFMLVGVGLLYWAHWEKKKAAQLEQIAAVCVKRVYYGSQRHGHGRSKSNARTYISVFEYTYGGITYTEKDAFNVGTNVGLPAVGETCTVGIDPKAPEKPYYFNRKSNLLTVLMGIAFIVLPLFGIIMYNVQS